MRRGTALLATGAALAATVLATVAGTSATAQQSGKDVVDIARTLPAQELRKMTEQRPLVAAASAIRKEVERGGHTGYTGIGLEEGRVALWWKGPLPAQVERVVDQARRTAPVRVAPARYSLAELKKASERLQGELRRDPSLGHSVKIATDGSGLVLATASDAAATARASAPARRGAVASAGVPVRTVQEQPLVERSRDDDSFPWSGGALLKNNGAPNCTSGFGVRNASGAQYILTAEHCGKAGDRYTNGRDQYIGTPGPANDPHDIMLIPTSQVDNFMYTGGRNDERGVRVDGWDWVFPGEYLCQSGVTSAGVTGGPVCNLKVLFFYNDSEDLVEAEQMNGQIAARGGDSGGPVYSAAASGGAIAKGTVTRSAGARLGFQDFGTAFRDFGVWIKN
ncbi:chymotrypsin family serine protease [Streptomyces yaizuensis]|uniref:S1 family peptidase n=1 Tax=Streptomyces yaizuensis TaxID=2989713 RepID=A0ABQ5PAV0_9ACTN|nr:hypothetical protein [Streptomyces sp. YSPA8]GLF99623.1 S1 family peptidase [Streptomyces sp. YSPA8]